MKAVLFEQFQSPPKIVTVDDPTPEPHGVVVELGATGVCRSDWHGWMGHDSDITLPHIPGHELAGTIAAIGKDVTKFKLGDRVTVPFVSGCGACVQCDEGHQQVCHNQFQPGFTHWGSFAQYVSLHQADLNVVALPDTIDFATAAALGCRFATSFRAVVDQGKISDGEWVVVHGCGGVGLSAVMIAAALGAQVIAVDINNEALALAKTMGAVAILNGSTVPDIPEAVMEITQGGAHISLDALGHPVTSNNSILSLRPRGKHIQVGLMLADHTHPSVPMAKIIAQELEIIGSHGMQAHRYDAMLAMIESGALKPELLVGEEISLEQAPDILINMDKFSATGATVITAF